MSEQTIKAALLKKSLNEEKRLATFLVLEPQDEDYTTSDYTVIGTTLIQ